MSPSLSFWTKSTPATSFCPAAYAAARSWKFGGGFYRLHPPQPARFSKPDITEVCAHYAGNVLYVMGDRDEVIPPEVDRMYRQSFRQARNFQTLLLADCPHPIHCWSAGEPAMRNDSLGTLAIHRFGHSSLNRTRALFLRNWHSGGDIRCAALR